MIEHPIGKRAGFWTVTEVITSIKEAFNFEQEQFGDIGKKAFRIFSKFIRPKYNKSKHMINDGVD